MHQRSRRRGGIRTPGYNGEPRAAGGRSVPVGTTKAMEILHSGLSTMFFQLQDLLDTLVVTLAELEGAVDVAPPSNATYTQHADENRRLNEWMAEQMGEAWPARKQNRKTRETRRRHTEPASDFNLNFHQATDDSEILKSSVSEASVHRDDGRATCGWVVGGTENAEASGAQTESGAEARPPPQLSTESREALARLAAFNAVWPSGSRRSDSAGATSHTPPERRSRDAISHIYASSQLDVLLSPQAKDGLRAIAEGERECADGDALLRVLNCGDETGVDSPDREDGDPFDTTAWDSEAESWAPEPLEYASYADSDSDRQSWIPEPLAHLPPSGSAAAGEYPTVNEAAADARPSSCAQAPGAQWHTALLSPQARAQLRELEARARDRSADTSVTSDDVLAALNGLGPVHVPRAPAPESPSPPAGEIAAQVEHGAHSAAVSRRLGPAQRTRSDSDILFAAQARSPSARGRSRLRTTGSVPNDGARQNDTSGHWNPSCEAEPEADEDQDEDDRLSYFGPDC